MVPTANPGTAAGPGVGIVGMVVIGFPFALAFFYLFASFSTSAQRAPTPGF